MTTPAAHLIVIAPGPDGPDNEEDFEYAMVCPGVSDACRYWQECTEGEHPTYDEFLDGPDAGDDMPVFHGQTHMFIDYDWMTRTDRCIVQQSGLESGEHTELLREAKDIPGVYPFEWEWDESVYLLGLLTTEATEPEKAMEALRLTEETP